MRSKLFKKYLLDTLIHFESEDMDYIKNPYSSDLYDLNFNLFQSDICWYSKDSAITDKPLTIVLDFEVKEKNFFTGRIRGFYLFELNIAHLKQNSITEDIQQKAEYFAFKEPKNKIVNLVDSSTDEMTFSYMPGFQDRVLSLLSK